MILFIKLFFLSPLVLKLTHSSTTISCCSIENKISSNLPKVESKKKTPSSPLKKKKKTENGI